VITQVRREGGQGCAGGCMLAPACSKAVHTHGMSWQAGCVYSALRAMLMHSTPQA
jgi:hypothetical protein